ncbi:hypothetical protein SCHPADRAFT_908368 [Schizopora paradoxa]|uniref:Hyaluronan/mRNA-binding protein domain-containing protein n=1 Tax=Schizopora paradoxa TaxID=27342 RepID=A0A0H2RA84_9AGAM|nr:hypothetical protein SCHPADRAFT_908368 [Schizopora paradoxa]
MTRTERSTSPRAIMKDRTESKSGYDKSLRKGGAGSHNWGSLEDELKHEYEALEDEGVEDADELDVDANAAPVGIDKTNTVLSDDDVKKAREFREQGLDGEANLSDIARTSAGATSENPAPSVEVGRDAATSILSS